MTALQQHSEEVLRESQTRYQRLFEHAHEGIFRITTQGYFVEVNPMFVSLLGYDSAQEILSFSGQDAVYIDPAQYQRVRQMCDTAGSVRNMELLWKKKNGEPIVVNLSACAAPGPDGRPRFYDGMILDVTQQKQADTAPWESEEGFRKIFHYS